MIRRLLLLFVGLSLLSLLGANAGFAEELAVIVNITREPKLEAGELPEIFLRKPRFWKEGERIVPVNRNAGSEARRIFDDGIFDFGPRQLASYWNRQYFLGVLPPPTLASDEAVLRVVAGEPRAIGYVLIDAVDDTVRVVMRIGTPSRVSSKAPPSP